MNAAKSILSITLGLMAAGCATKTGEISAEGITAIRTACPTVAVPAATGDITLFNPPKSEDQSALDVSATLTRVRSTCRHAAPMCRARATL